MKYFDRNLKYIAAAFIAAAIGITASTAFAQAAAAKDTAKAEYKDKDKGFCSNNNWSSDDRVSVNELREMTVASTGTVMLAVLPLILGSQLLIQAMIADVQNIPQQPLQTNISTLEKIRRMLG